MEHPKIDFLKEKYDLTKPDEKPFLFFKKTLIISFFILATVGAAFSFNVGATSDGEKSPTELSLFSIIRNFILPEDDFLDGESEDRVNILLTGIGGVGHEGAQLTDTILFASYRPSTKKVAFMSLPRDMTVPIPGRGYQKINSVNAYAESANAGTGGSATAQFVGETLKQPVHYYARVDFDGFAELINIIGGIDVYVDHPFTDSAYPILGKEKDTCGNSKASMNATADELAGTASGPAIPPPNYACRFKVLTFKEGMMHMDGETALDFVRSRHGNNGEGSDFARSRRQQKVMLAVKDKVFSVSTFFNPVRITGIFDTLDKNISTNLSVSQLMRLGKEFKDLKSEDVVSHVIDDSPDSPLYATTLNGAYVLLPKNDDWKTLQQMAQYIYTPAPDTTQKRSVVTTTPDPVTPEPVAASVRLEIQNGTNVTGLGVRASQLLQTHKEFQVIKVGNAVTRDYTQTVIYDLTSGSNPEELKALQGFFQAKIASESGENGESTVTLANEEGAKPAPTGSKIDFLVILGQSARDLVMK